MRSFQRRVSESVDERLSIYEEECLPVGLFDMLCHTVWPNATKLAKNDLSIQTSRRRPKSAFSGKRRTLRMLQAERETDLKDCSILGIESG